MLLNFNHEQPLYIFGDAAPAQELKNFIQNETKCKINLLSHKQFKNVGSGSQCMIGFQNGLYRNNLLQSISMNDFIWPTFIHSKAHVENINRVGKGCVILNFAHIGFDATVSDFCYISTGCQLSHASQIGKNCMLAPGVIIGGSTCFGENIWVGLNSTFSDKLSICSDTVFAMTSVVNKSITESGSYYGNRKIKSFLN